MAWRNVYNPFTKTWERKFIDETPHPISKAPETVVMFDDVRSPQEKEKIKRRARFRRWKARMWAKIPAWIHLLRGAE